MSKWDEEGFPQVGWKCVGMKDLGEGIKAGEIPYVQCEMCGHEKLRFVFFMRHPEVEGVLRVGAKCAGKMVADKNFDPKYWEQEMRNFSNRLERFLKRKWYQNGFGDYWIVYDGFEIELKKGYYTWSVHFLNRRIDSFKGKRIDSFEMAKLVAFYALEHKI